MDTQWGRAGARKASLDQGEAPHSKSSTSPGAGPVNRQEIIMSTIYYAAPEVIVCVETGMPERAVRIGIGRTVADARADLSDTPIQSAGRDPATDGFVAFDMVGVVLGEVLLDEEFNSMALPNGRCVEIVDGTLSSPLPE